MNPLWVLWYLLLDDEPYSGPRWLVSPGWDAVIALGYLATFAALTAVVAYWPRKRRRW